MSKSFRRRSSACFLSVVASALVGTAVPASARAVVPRFPVETVSLQDIKLPAEVFNAAAPVYARDGEHLLFFGNVVADGTVNPDPNRGKLHVWTVGTNGAGAHCVSCGTDEPLVGEAEQPGLLAPFPDGKRVFYGPYGDPRVLQCLPSVLNCRTATTYKIDLSAARPALGLIPPGGAVTAPALDAAGAASPKLSPDGKYIAFSDLRTDSLESMVLAKLTFAGDKYVASDPRVLNPPGPTSPTDPDPVAWSASSGLFEFKSFVDGGRAITYVQVGGSASGNPDLWKLDLKTGRRTRLTSAPEWEEDMSISPDGRSMYVGVDSQTRHYVDWAGLMPFRGFFDASWIGALAIVEVSSAQQRSCAPFSAALLPASGDDHGRLVGQVLDPYTGGDVRDAGQLNGWPVWSPDSTAVALSTQRFSTLTGAPVLRIAHLAGRKPTRPLPIVSSAPGSWAPAPQQYHGAIGAATTVTLHGLKSGTVTVHYANPLEAITPVQLTATYAGYSDDGRSFVDGTQTVKRGGTTVELVNDLNLHGAHSGSLHGDVTFGLGGRPFTVSGTQTATYDGTSVTGPKTPAQLCQAVRGTLPGRSALTVHARRFGDRVRVEVTSAQGGAGANERAVDRRPVRGATVTIGGRSAITDANGIAVIHGVTGTQVRVTAGDTFDPVQAAVR
jgi:hypothetical protein